MSRTTSEKGGDRRSTRDERAGAGGKDAAEICAAHCLQILIVDRSSSSAASLHLPTVRVFPVKLVSVFTPRSARDLLTPFSLSLSFFLLPCIKISVDKRQESYQEIRDELGKRDRMRAFVANKGVAS